ncbi:MAG TPA: UDP-N-acetylmuramoyl-L-alanine--D-glutamate ligase [Solirubrobacteraceae bacterium]|jgi:UDP-N-acetylmuramoylalanine--D-glutamate ligase
MRFSELEGARVGVWGAGREIASFARQLAKRLPGARIAVVAFDEPPADAGAAAAELGAPDADVVSGEQIGPALARCDAIVRSPGVSIYRAELQATDVPVTTSTSLWLAEHGPRGVLAITGTKGKSTTAALAHHLARSAGVETLLAGNIGSPALDLLDEEDEARPVVLELSSYQIADLASGPEVALITNLYDEHLDWHRSREAYRADKLRILGLPGVSATVLNARDPLLSREQASRRFATPDGWDVVPGQGVAFAGEPRARGEQLPLRGEHNLLDLCAALTGLEALGIEPPSSLPDALAGFAGLPHRLQELAEIDGVLWVDDSISTTPQSALAALAAYPERQIVLIAGGQDRGQDYDELAAELERREAALIAIPTTGPRVIEAALRAGLSHENALAAPDLAAAVELARVRAGHGSVVLLSPAAPSYDHFSNFEARGRRFSDLLGRSPAQDSSAGPSLP